jgi:hypothetical protein
MSKSAAIYIPVGVLLIVFLTVIGVSGFLRIMDIEVVGSTRYTDEAIIAVSGITAGDNMLFIDAEVAERRIITAMPFISSASVTRVPPDGVRIEVEESSPLAKIDFRGELLIFDSSGRILEVTVVPQSGLVEVLGITPVDPAEGAPLRVGTGGEMNLLYMRDVLAALEREGIEGDVSFLDVSNTGRINFGYQGRFRVILGGPSNVRQKLDSLPRMIYGADGINAQHGDSATGDIDMSGQQGEWRFFLSP